MAFENTVANFFRMDEAAWARHANPWSVFTRATVLPLLIVAIWSRVWIGQWSWLLVVLGLLWTWLNPRLFPPPASTRNWASKSVLGERVWLNRQSIPIPEHHRGVPHLLNAIAFTGSLLVIWGLVALAVWPTLLGLALTYAGKFWFLDRMVWLYTEMQNTDPTYQSWLY